TDDAKPEYFITVTEDITDKKIAQEALQASEERYRSIFDSSPIAIWEEDFTAIKSRFIELKISGVENFKEYFDKNPEEILNLAGKVKILNINNASIKLLDAENKEQVSRDLNCYFTEESFDIFKSEMVALAEGHTIFESEIPIINAKGVRTILDLSLSVQPGYEDTLSRVLVSFINITEKKQAEKALKESEEKYSRLFTEMLAGVCVNQIIMDDCGKPVDYLTLDSNKYYETLLNVKKEDIIGVRLSQILPAEECKKWVELFGNVITGGEPIQYEQYSKKNNKYFRGSAFKLEEDKFVVTFNDVTDEKLSALAIRESEEKYRLLHENAGIGIGYYKPDGTVISYNKLAASNMNGKPEDFNGKSIFELFPKPAADFYFARIQQAVESDSPQVYEDLVELPNQNKWFLSTFSKITDFEGKVIGIQIISQDITKQKTVEQAIIEEKKFSEMLIESLPGIFYMFDSSMNALRWNKNKQQFLGLTGEQMRNHFILDSIAENDKNKLIESVKKIFSEGESQEVIKIIRHDCKEFSYHLTGKRLDTDRGPLMLGVGIDISDRVKMEHELIEAKEKAEKSDKLKTSFLQNMSHEIRTPLNGIMGFSTLLKDFDSLSSDEKTEYIELIINSSNRLLGIVDDVLQVSHLDSGLLKFNYTNFRISEVFQYFHSMYSEKIIYKNLKLSLNLAEDCANILINTDKDKFYQILTNLFNNALKFTDEGMIEFGCFLNDNYLNFYVKDTGIGIESNYLECIFDRFWQYEAFSSRKFGGTGLGLSITKGLANLLNFDIHVESTVGSGSTFTLKLPVNCIIDYMTRSESNSLNVAEKIDLSNLRFLIAEDEFSNYLYLDRLLKKEKALITWVKNGLEAVEIVDKDSFDIILMDLKMPLMDGYEATRRIKSKYPALPIIAQTAYSHHYEKAMAIEAGCNDFISKPMKKDDLFRIIKDVLKK
ncbi:MAG: hypothetical protein QG635_1538, partial [Bacteroidota bacterium]|nr:hypothetical protein [Bacteroidota bacterium]